MFGLNAQKGEGMSNVILYISVGIFVVIFGLKVVPVYIENNSLESTLDSVYEQFKGKDIQDISNKEIKRSLRKFFVINTVDDAVTDSLEIVRKGKDVSIVFDYEIRTEFVGNIDLILKFHSERVLTD